MLNDVRESEGNRREWIVEVLKDIDGMHTGYLHKGELVRCKECKYNYSKALNHGKMQPRCDFTDWKLSENDYCSRGEREGE